MRRSLAAFTWLACVLLAGPALAQEGPDSGPTPPDQTDQAPVEEAPPETRLVTGSVVDSESKEPVAGATVSVAGTAISTITDDAGFFVLQAAPAGAVTLSVTQKGFIQTDATLPEARNTARVLLTVDPTQVVAKERTLRGKVTEQKTGEPIPGAIVTVPTTGQIAITEDDGSFTIENAPGDALDLSISGSSYADATLSVAAGISEVNATMSYEQSEQILITGRAPQIVRQNLANGSSVVKGKDLNRVSAQTVDDALTGKVAGANIQRNSGAPGGGVQVSLRGVSTINAQSSPLYVIDGVIVSNVAIPSGISAVTASTRGSNASSNQDNQVNRIADINPNDIENIEILKGASAAALYGSKAANGVVIITTKRGKRGAEPRVSITQRFGFSALANKLGSRTFETVEEAVDTFGPQAAVMFEEGRTYDHEQALFGQNKLAMETIASISGGLKTTSYHGSFLVKDEPGILKGTGYQKQSARVGFTQDFGDKFTLGVNSSLIHSTSQRGMTQNDNAGVSHYMVLPSTPSFLNLNRGDDGMFPQNPFIGSGTNPLQTVDLMNDTEEVWRFLGAINANLRAIDKPSHGLTFTGTFGVDYFQQENDLFFPPELYFEPTDGLPGTSLDSNAENRNLNANVSAAFRVSPEGASWKSVTTLGAAAEERRLDTLYVISKNLNAGLERVDAGTNIDLTESRLLVRERSAYLQEELLLLDEDLSIVGALLAEQSSANGNADNFFLFPKAQAAYKLPKLSNSIDTMRVRTSYGEAGNQPLYGQKFTALAATSNVEGIPGITVNGTLGDPNIEPERQREVEVGFDMVGFGDRVVAEVSAYQKNISNMIQSRTLAPSTGFGVEFFNGGTMRNRGLELMLQVKPVDNDYVKWTSRTIFTRNRSRITSLPVPAFNAGGFGTSLGAFRIEEGATATQIVGNRGLKPDGTCCEVVKLGDTEPDFRMSFVNNFQFGKNVGLTSLWDWQKGSDVINLTKFLYDLSGNTADFEENGMQRLEDFATDAGVYVEDASFLKLRELSLYYDVPESIVKLLGPMNSARISVSGRNLITVTNYSGLDPEVSNFGNQPIGRNIDVAPYPWARSFWFQVSADF